MDEDEILEIKEILPKGSGICRSFPEGLCELCGEKAETRPYGPRGENVCFKCGMKNEKAAQRQFIRRTFNENIC